MNDSSYFQSEPQSFTTLQLGCRVLWRAIAVTLVSFSTSAIGQSAAQAQLPLNSSQHMANFVQSVLEIELARETTLHNTQGANPNGSIPVFDCNLEVGNAINTTGLSHDVMSHLQNFCGQSQAILQKYNLSPNDFYQMRRAYGENPRQYPQITQSFQRLCENNRYSQLQICR
ncbi:DUF4168 domain-containing protein [Roseofilum casamattae]|uniref:DUF4168 domain-containing protein n=1 Tax=Roseofilum casamattae BLCC-M143 TaxID=3022442 RepID=A0ABT7BU87_9CYAN|nr:DUF4168 domain-containing protein [Roseofilum casamattae]MDJ1182748.1 DUF4168 domain-containing protein [Roseofilum casamattae BLCC-M143]